MAPNNYFKAAVYGPNADGRMTTSRQEFFPFCDLDEVASARAYGAARTWAAKYGGVVSVWARVFGLDGTPTPCTEANVIGEAVE